MKRLSVIVLSSIFFFLLLGEANASKGFCYILEIVKSLPSIERKALSPEESWKIAKRVTEEMKGTLAYIGEHGLEDVTLTPTETIRRGGGDCEDLAGFFLYEALWGGIAQRDLGLVTYMCASKGGIRIGHIAPMLRKREKWYVIETSDEDYPYIEAEKYAKRTLSQGRDVEDFIWCFGLAPSGMVYLRFKNFPEPATLSFLSFCSILKSTCKDVEGE